MTDFLKISLNYYSIDINSLVVVAWTKLLSLKTSTSAFDLVEYKGSTLKPHSSLMYFC